MSSHLTALAETEIEGVQGVDAVQVPLQKFKQKDEGYAIDWSPLVPGRLVSGNHWPTSAATWNIDKTPFTGHTGSVEDLQWIKALQYGILIWGGHQLRLFKHIKADVNVLSWNRLASCMLASGSDDGTISIRDLRLLKGGDTVIAHFEYHKQPITSIEWSPHEASSLAVSSADNHLTRWWKLSRDLKEK
ncbi:hypothetical protein TSUD_89230 [Trifolium subterraneum]|uniref:Uncharacterized protein n=1 Tax=Trifolium subterraneum TaxID=3900 RepID=A0A2Z6MA05_TRISU|nr:hypothetical protein TSUD_89230 [Trifolium subterraneum]